MSDVPRPEPLPPLSEEEIAGRLFALRERWRNPGKEAGQKGMATLSRQTGFPPAHVHEALKRAFAPFTQRSIRRLVRLGRGPRAGSPWLLAILAGRIPAVAVNALFWSLAARVPLAVKSPGALDAFTALLVRSLARMGGSLGPCVTHLTFPSGTGPMARLVESAPLCLAYGSDHTFRAVTEARRGRPTLGGGHRESFVVVFREALERDGVSHLARAIARDSAVYDQDGCLSPQAVLVEEGGGTSPRELARRIHDELVGMARPLPPSIPPLEEAARLRIFAEECRYTARASGGRVFPERGAPIPLVAVLPGQPYRTGPGHRVLQVLPFCDEPDPARLLPSMSGHVQGVAVAGPRARLESLFEADPGYRAGYVCAPGRLQRPPAVWAENGIIITKELARLAR
ncbi:MAG: hypothetical protein ISR64_00180 [Deltaproteobacteria bacterium]|nr:hypothetical protein [Deltaproteobacteria bacterium]